MGWCTHNLCEVSPESEDIFDFIMEIYRAHEGKWDQYAINFPAR
jgi:hypothetical protein